MTLQNIHRFFSSAIILACTAVLAEGQTVEKITPKGTRQVAITASAKGRSVLQWTFDDRPDAIWNSISETRTARRGKVSFLAPRHAGLTPRYRILDNQPVTPGTSLFDPHQIRVLKLEITGKDMKKMLENLPVISDGGDDGGGVVGPGDDGGVVIGKPGEIIGNGDNPAPPPPPGGEIVDPGDPGDFPGDPQQLAEPVYEYVPALASFGGGGKARLGIRIKGNASLISAVIDKRSNYPFKIDMNYYKSGQNLDGIKKFNLHPVVSNKATASLPGEPPAVYPGAFGLEEFLSYGAFRAFGVPASRTGWMDVYLNGKYLGLYTVLENTDSAFMERNFGSPGGSTYKPEGEYLEWKGAKYDKYPFLNWKGGGDGTHQSIIHLMDVINHKPVARFTKVIDVQSIFNYTAGNVALGNWDTYEALGHNYLLHEGSPGRFYMLPWDMNLSQAKDPGSSLYGKVEQHIDPPEGFELPVPALTHRLYRMPENDARYRATLKAFIEGPGSRTTLNARIDDAVALLGSRLEESAIKVLRDNIEIRIGKIKKLLNTPAAR